jgi:hypothetical protein
MALPRFNKKLNIYSSLAKKKGINNVPGVDMIDDPSLTYEFIMRNLEALHSNCVGPIIDHFNNLPGSSGNSIGITSAYRCKELNAAINPPGVKNSQHIKGYAVDLIYTEGEASELFNWAILNLPTWGQMIWEFPEKGAFSGGNYSPSWLHISYQEGKNNKDLSLASSREDLHEYYKGTNTTRRGVYTHGITDADQTLI